MQKILVKKLTANKTGADTFETNDFDVSEYTKPFEADYWWSKDESKVEVKEDFIYLILVFSKKNQANPVQMGFRRASVNG